MADDIVIELVNQQLAELEKDGKNYVIEGYPRTRVQAIALQRMAVVPDKFFVLGVSESAISKKIKSSLAPSLENKSMSEAEAEQIVQNAILEYNM